MRKYINRESLSWIVEQMMYEAKKKKRRISVVDFSRDLEGKYWCSWADRVTRSLEHYCDTAGIYVDVNPFDMKYTIGQLEVIKFILDRRRNCGNKIL